jgi:fatty acid synthase subunit alpha, fungi type
MVEGARHLQVGDRCKAEAHIVSIVNNDSGKVIGHIYRDGVPVIEVVSSFLYRGRFSDYKNTFDTTGEPEYLFELKGDADVGVL